MGDLKIFNHDDLQGKDLSSDVLRYDPALVNRVLRHGAMGVIDTDLPDAIAQRRNTGTHSLSYEIITRHISKGAASEAVPVIHAHRVALNTASPEPQSHMNGPVYSQTASISDTGADQKPLRGQSTAATQLPSAQREALEENRSENSERTHQTLFRADNADPVILKVPRKNEPYKKPVPDSMAADGGAISPRRTVHRHVSVETGVLPVVMRSALLPVSAKIAERPTAALSRDKTTVINLQKAPSIRTPSPLSQNRGRAVIENSFSSLPAAIPDGYARGKVISRKMATRSIRQQLTDIYQHANAGGSKSRVPPQIEAESFLRSGVDSMTLVPSKPIQRNAGPFHADLIVSSMPRRAVPIVHRISSVQAGTASREPFRSAGLVSSVHVQRTPDNNGSTLINSQDRQTPSGPQRINQESAHQQQPEEETRDDTANQTELLRLLEQFNANENERRGIREWDWQS